MHTRRARRWWRIFGRSRCTCGLPWPCIEAWMEKSRRREEHRARTAVSDPAPRVPVWAAPTMPLLQIGRAGALTPAQERRARGDRSC
jgi:hypothetical protein